MYCPSPVFYSWVNFFSLFRHPHKYLPVSKLNKRMKWLIYSHIFAGVISLVVAPVALVVVKGGAAHRLWGKIFFWCMAWIFVSATIMALDKGNMFLLLIGVFSFYNVWSGYRALYLKQLYLGKGLRWYDWLAAVIALGFNTYFVVFGGWLIYTHDGGAFAYLSVMFGVLGLLNVGLNIKRFLTRTNEKHQWLYAHIGGFLGGFIASVTAFSTQTMEFLPSFLVWAWPTLVGSPVIAYFIRYYRNKLAQGARLSELVNLRG